MTKQVIIKISNIYIKILNKTNNQIKHVRVKNDIFNEMERILTSNSSTRICFTSIKSCLVPKILLVLGVVTLLFLFDNYSPTLY